MGVDIIKPVPYELDPRRYIIEKDDFVRGTATSGDIGDLGWSTKTVVATGGNVFATTGFNTHGPCNGYIMMQTNAAGNAALCIHAGRRAQVFSDFNVGSTLSVRVTSSDLTTMVWWAGLSRLNNTVPVAAAAMDFIGFRHDSTVDGNVYGVVKENGGGESAVSIAAASNTAFQTFTMERTGTSDFRFTGPGGTSVVSITGTANYPVGTQTYEAYVGVQTLAAANRDLIIDFWSHTLNADRR